MSGGRIAFDPASCDFITVRRRGDFCVLQPWRLEGRLGRALHAVVGDLFDGATGDDQARAEFALGFVAAIDVVASGRLRLEDAGGRSELTGLVERAFRSMHGRLEPDAPTRLMGEACAAIGPRERGAS